MQNFRQRYQILIEELGSLRVKRDEPLSRHTTFKIGGPADLFFETWKKEDLIRAVQLCQKLKIPYFILGRGSNILVSDKGFSGLVIKNRTSQIKVLQYSGKVGKTRTVLIEADSGVGLNRLVRWTIEEGLKGLEVFLSIPGTVGGAIKINAHFRPEKGEFIGNFVKKGKILSEKGEVKEVEKNYFSFGYDKSILQKKKDILLSVVFELKKVGDKRILWRRAEEAVKYRRLRQPLSFSSAGCIFKNPEGTKGAGFLIDQLGLKGKRIGGAMISPIHANFIVNTGNAKAEDVVKLIEICKRKVKEVFGINLEEEIEYIGF